MADVPTPAGSSPRRQPRTSPLLRSQMIAPALRMVRSVGGDPDRVIRALGLPSNSESELEIIVPLQTLRSFWEEVEGESGDPLFGIHLAGDLQRGRYGLLEYACRHAPTLGEALGAMVRFGALLDEIVDVNVTRRDDTVVVTHSVKGEPACLGRHGNECYVSVLLRFAREFTGTPAIVDRVWFAHAAPRQAQEVAGLIGALQVDFGLETNGVVAPLSLVDAPLVTADPTLFALLVEQAEQLVVARGTQSRFIGHVRQAIREQLRIALPTLASTARVLRMNTRALQRRLLAENASFAGLTDAVRVEVASKLLREDKLSLWDVAIAMHYSDASAFVRAFKRKTGITPGAFRQRS
jgi:AraC-like DNA-binding protein